MKFMEKIKEILNSQGDKKIILLGNEAIVRGALEAGVQFVSTYPGTPASEIGNVFYKISNLQSRISNLFEFSTNEKVALEAAIGASFSGLKSLVAMKNFGLNVCLEALLPFCYTGAKGPTVIVVADDPSCHSSAQSEENTRAIAYLAHIPILEPSDPQECKDFTKLAFQISEKFEIPVILRTTTRVAHQRMPVKLGKIVLKKKPPLGKFEKNPQRFVTMPPRVLEMKKELLEKIKKIKEFSEKSEINLKFLIGKKSAIALKLPMGIITSGISYLYVMEALKELKISLPVLKLGFFYPLAEKKIEKFIKNLKKVLIVEELEPYLEKEVERIAKNVNCNLKVIGKEIFSEVGELKPEIVISGIAKFIGKKSPQFSIINYQSSFPKRSPRLCPNCPYWFVFSAVKKALRQSSRQPSFKNIIFGGDIGCYMLAGLPPISLQDYLSCMGSSIGIAHGIKKSTNQKLITFIGDSTFFHVGIPALINTIFNNSNPLIIVMDNLTTAMTGHQPHPGAFSQLQKIKIENIVKSCGVKNLKVIDPANQKEMISTIKKFLNKKEVSVIVAKRLCGLLSSRLEREKKFKK
jgi:indolepyruvate ferredoxin oxidoreductase alpha subunit